MTSLTTSSFASLVDHTVLAPTTVATDIDRVCDEAVEFATFSVCVNPAWVSRVAERLTGSGVATCAVAGFPLGADVAEAVGASARIAIEEGATEIDTVIPMGHLIDGQVDAVRRHLEAIRTASSGALLKVIIESAVLNDEQIVTACELSVKAGANFVKTSTGFHAAGGASAEAVRLMRATVGPDIGVKASGGIRTLADVEAMVQAGASRLGMSATGAVISELTTGTSGTPPSDY